MTPWIHIGECPVCVNGLCRIRFCEDRQGHGHLYAMCDECEAIWTEPSTSTKRQFPNVDEPECPLCSQPLYGPQAHWATAQELNHTDWSEAAIFEVPSYNVDEDQGTDGDLALETPPVDLITSDDIAGDLDAPPQPSKNSRSVIETRPTVEEPLASETDVAYGQDEPKPGC